jgi:hypothetical protein
MEAEKSRYISFGGNHHLYAISSIKRVDAYLLEHKKVAA